MPQNLDNPTPLLLLVIYAFFFQAMGCCGMKGDKEEADDEKRMRKTNKEIEKQIQKDKQVGWHIITGTSRHIMN